MSQTTQPDKDPVCPPGGMTLDEYRVRAKEMVDYISHYLETIRDRRVFPDVSPGYMSHLVPDTCPNTPDSWKDIIADVERVIMPGITHWQSPYMHAYFPALNCFPSMLGDMLADAVNCLGFTWASSPACTELETIVMDWLGKMIGLPPLFLHGNKMPRKQQGGGCIQTTASECTFVTLLAARTDAIRRFRVTSPDVDDAEINGRLIGYCSDQAHSSVEKAGLIGLVKLRFLPSDDQLSLRGDTLQEAVYRDREMGLIPFYVCATLGTTGACAFDNLREIGPVCQSENLWLHIDAAYAGSAFICPEYRNLMAGIEYAHSFAFNPSKWLMVHFDCSAMWVRDATALHRTFNVEPLYLQHENSGAAIDYMHWQIALSRRFRALKLWFVLRSYGVEGLQAHIRRGVERAIYFENLVKTDRRFEIISKRHLGMVVFRMVGPNQMTVDLLKRLNKEGRIHMVPACLKGRYIIRFTVTSQYTTVDDIDRDWKIIADMGTKIQNETRLRQDEESILENEEEEEEEEEEEDEEEVEDGDNDDEEVYVKTHMNNGKLRNVSDKEKGITGRKKMNGYHEGSLDDTSVVYADGQSDKYNEDGNDERNRTSKKRSNNKDSNGCDVKGNGVKSVSFPEDLTQHRNTMNQDGTTSSPPAKPTASFVERRSASNIKISTSKSAAARRREYSLSLLLSNVPMSPKIVNGSFAALFDGDESSSCFDFNLLTRKLGMNGEFIRLSPRKRGMLGDHERQKSLDYGVLSATQKTCPTRMKLMGSLDSKIDDILEMTSCIKVSDKFEKKKEQESTGTNYGKNRGNSNTTTVGINTDKTGNGIIGRDTLPGKGEVRGNGSDAEHEGLDGRVTEKENWDTGHDNGEDNTYDDEANNETDHKKKETVSSVTSSKHSAGIADETRKKENEMNTPNGEGDGTKSATDENRTGGHVCPMCGHRGLAVTP